MQYFAVANYVTFTYRKKLHSFFRQAEKLYRTDRWVLRVFLWDIPIVGYKRSDVIS